MMDFYKVVIDSAMWNCEQSIVDCSMLYHYLMKNGHSIIHDPSQADYIIINSCGFLKRTEDKTLDLFQKYHLLKKKQAKIVMFGCLVKINQKHVASLDVIPISHDETSLLDQFFYRTIKFEEIAPYCDDDTKKILLGTQRFTFAENMPFLLSKMLFPFSKKIRRNYQQIINHVIYRNRNFVLIGTGCTGECSYCVIKKAKGSIHSREIREILMDINNFPDHSKNVFLVAEDCGCYGVDIRTNLLELLKNIHQRFPRLHIDLNNINPVWLEKQPKEYFEVFQRMDIDFALIPIQSGSPNIITQMNRHYNPDEVIKIIDNIKKISPHTLFYSHFIIGFPGESTRDFLKTLIATKHFDYPVPFRYSSNKGTVSASLPHQKSAMTISLRYLVFMVTINIVIFYKLLTTESPH